MIDCIFIDNQTHRIAVPDFFLMHSSAYLR